MSIFFVMCGSWSLCSVSWVVSSCLKCLEPISLPALAQELCVCWGFAFSALQTVENSTLAFISCLHRASKSAKSERVGYFQAFPGHVTRMWPSKGHIRAIQSPLWTPHFLLVFFLSLEAASFSSQLVVPPQAAAPLTMPLILLHTGTFLCLHRHFLNKFYHNFLFSQYSVLVQNFWLRAVLVLASLWDSSPL